MIRVGLNHPARKGRAQDGFERWKFCPKTDAPQRSEERPYFGQNKRVDHADSGRIFGGGNVLSDFVELVYRLLRFRVLLWLGDYQGAAVVKKRFVTALFVVSLVFSGVAVAVIPVVAAVVETGTPIAAELLLASRAGSVLANLPATVAAGGQALSSTWSGLIAGLGIAAAYLQVGNKYQIPLVPASSVTSGGVVQSVPPMPVPSKVIDITGVSAALAECFALMDSSPWQSTQPQACYQRNYSDGVAIVSFYTPDYIPPSDPNSFRRENWLNTDHSSELLSNLIGQDVCRNQTNITYAVSFCRGVSNIEPKDGKYRFNRAVQGFTPDTSDPDWGGLDLSKYSSSGSPISFDSTTGTPPVRTTVAANGSGTVIRQDVETQSNNVPNTTSKTAVISDGGGVQNYYENVFNNTTINNVTNTYSSESGTGAGTGTGSATPVTVNVQLPADLQVQTAPDTVLRSSVDAIWKLIDDLFKPAGDPATPSEKSASDIKNGSGLSEAFNPLKGWSVPSHASECPAIQINYTIQGFTVDIAESHHCAVFTDNAQLISTFMLALYSFLSLKTVLKA